MKKLIYGGLFLTVLGMGVVGCKKRNIEPTSIQTSQKSIQQEVNFENIYRVGTDGKMLVFESSESYEKAISNLDSTHIVNFFSTISALDFKSYYQIKKPSSTSDQYLDNLLNEDLAIKIGNFIYRVNMEDEKVFVLHAKFNDQYSELVDENVRNTNIQVYSTEENVIDLVESGSTIEKGLFCKARKAYNKTTSSNGVNINPDAAMHATVQYNSSGIMHRLQADVILYDQNSLSDLRVYIAFNNCSYKQRCGSSLNNYSHPWRVPSSASYAPLTTLYRVQLYSSTKKLENYNFTARGRVEDWQNPTSTLPYSIIFTDWIYITDY
jgi:hypothetical protein